MTNPYNEFLPDEELPPEDLGAVVGDVVRQAGSRVVEGVAGLPGVFGDAVGLGKSAGNWMANQAAYLALGREPIAEEDVPDPLGISDALPTSTDTKKFFGVERRKPTTRAGKSFDESILGDMAEGAPAALLTGPKKLIEGGIRRVIPETAKAVLKYDVAPRAIGEGAAKGTEALGVSEDWQNVARTVAEVGTAGIAGLRTMPKLAAATRDQIRDAGSKLFEAAKKQGVAFQRPVVRTLASDIDQEIRSMGFNKKLHPQSWSLVKEIRTAANEPGPMDYSRYSTLREMASDAVGKADGGDLKRAGRVARILDKFMADPPPGSFTGNPKLAAKMAKTARDLWARQHKVRIIEGALTKIRNASPSTPEDVATRTAFRNIANNEDLMKQFSQAERSAIEEVVRAGKFERMNNFMSRWAISSGRLRGLGLFAAGSHFGGTEGGIAALIAPEAAKSAVSSMTRRSMQKVDTMVRRGDDVNIDMWPGTKPSIRGGLFLAADPPRQRNEDNPYSEFLP